MSEGTQALRETAGGGSGALDAPAGSEGSVAESGSTTATSSSRIESAATAGDSSLLASAAGPVGFLMRLARALHAAGSPAHRLEDALTQVALGEGIETQFFSTPTSIFGAFGPSAEQRMVLARVEPGSVDLELLSDLDELLEDLASRRIDLATADRRLERIEQRPPRYGLATRVVGFGLVSSGAARFFGGSWTDMAVAAGVGLAIGVLVETMGPRRSGGRVLDPLAALVASLLAYALAGLGVDCEPFLVILAGLIVLLPGLTVTVAMNELATRHLVSGASRIAGAATTFVLLAFGVAFGSQLGSVLGAPVVARDAAPVMPSWSVWLALAASAIGLTVLLRARPRDLGWVALAAALAVGAGRLGTGLLGTELGAFAGALLVGVAGNVFARLLRRPSALVQVPGLLLLVPGSVGFRSLAALLERETLAGIQTAFSMVIVSIGLVAGLLVAGAVVPPRRSL